MTKTVGIFVFEDVEVLDFAGPYEVFTCASRVHLKNSGETHTLFEVMTIGATRKMLQARAGLSVYPEYAFDSHPHVDILIIPGGVVQAELDNPQIIDWIKRSAAGSEIVASVCTGAFLLAQAGLLDGRHVTTHWEDIADLKAMFPALQVVSGPRWVEQGEIMTSGGISAGIDMSLHIVERIAGRPLAEATAHQMEFDWKENP